MHCVCRFTGAGHFIFHQKVCQNVRAELDESLFKLCGSSAMNLDVNVCLKSSRGSVVHFIKHHRQLPLRQIEM